MLAPDVLEMSRKYQRILTSQQFDGTLAYQTRLGYDIMTRLDVGAMMGAGLKIESAITL